MRSEGSLARMEWKQRRRSAPTICKTTTARPPPRIGGATRRGQRGGAPGVSAGVLDGGATGGFASALLAVQFVRVLRTTTVLAALPAWGPSPPAVAILSHDVGVLSNGHFWGNERHECLQHILGCLPYFTRGLLVCRRGFFQKAPASTGNHRQTPTCFPESRGQPPGQSNVPSFHDLHQQ